MNLLQRLEESLGDTYTFERELKGGAMSRVFVAESTRDGRKVVLKVLAAERAAGISVERFKREILFSTCLQHPNIVPIVSSGEVAGQPYLVMPYVRGESLRSRLELGPLPLRDAMTVLTDVARALAYAHAEGVVHRDIKPDNVLLSDGSAVVTDFGIAKAVSASSTGERHRELTASLTDHGTRLGTPAYMSPEQVVGDRVDAPADVYAWGLLAYEVLSGRHPYAHRTTVQQVLAAQLAEVPSPLVTAESNVPEPLRTLVMRCLKKEPSRRPASGRELLAALEMIAASSGTMPMVRVTPAPDRARARPRTTRRLLALGVVVTVVVAGAIARGLRERAEAANVIRSVAVVPFTITGGDSTDSYLARGISDELAVTLGRLPGVRVAPLVSASVLQARGLAADEVARKLSVESVLTGSIRRDGDRLRVTAELTEAHGSRLVWAEQLEEQRDDVFAVEDRITRAIVRALRVRLSHAAAAAATHGTENPEAHDLYLRGQYFLSWRSEAALHRAIAYFREAAARDSSYVLALSGMAQAYAVGGWYSYMSPHDGYGAAKAFAQRALRLDGTSAEAHAILGDVALYYDWSWPEAQRHLAQAIQLDSAYAGAHLWYANYELAMNRVDEALESFDRARRADPLNLLTIGAGCWGLYMARHYAQAVARCGKALDLDSTFAIGLLWRGQAYTMMGDTTLAFRDLEASVRLSGRSTITVAGLAHARARAGHASATHALLDDLTSSGREYVPAYEIALVYAALGDRERAFAWLDRAYHERSHGIAFLRVDPALDPLRGDPRFRVLLERARLN